MEKVVLIPTWQTNLEHVSAKAETSRCKARQRFFEATVMD